MELCTSATEHLLAFSKRIEGTDPDQKSNANIIMRPNTKRSKVKQMAARLKSTIEQLMKGDKEMFKYKTLVNDFSPKVKQPSEDIYVKPIPKPRTRFFKSKVPVPTPRTSLNMPPKNEPEVSKGCIAPEDVFAKLSVKEKAQLYTLYAEDITRRNAFLVNKAKAIEHLDYKFRDLFPKPTSPPVEDVVVAESKDTPAKEFGEKSLKSSDIPPSQNPMNNKQSQNSNTCYQNEQQDGLLLFGVKKDHKNSNEDKNNTNQSEIDEEKQKSLIDRMIDEAILQMSTVENDISKSTPKQNNLNCNKTLEAEKIESYFNKTTTKVLQAENPEKSPKLVRKRKLEQQINTTESETDLETKKGKLENLKPTSNKEDSSETKEPDLEDFIKYINSPNKIKTAYTLAYGDVERLSSGVVADQPGFLNSTDTASQQLAEAIEMNLNSFSKLSKEDICFSTPIKRPLSHSLADTDSGKRMFSPIPKPPKRRRKSLHDIEQRNSLPMQVIKEEQPLVLSPPAATDQSVYANSPAITNTSLFTATLSKEKTSQFWLKCGDFCLSLDIDYIEPMRLRSLYEIFSQCTSETKDLHFGIDDNKFSVNNPLDDNATAQRRSPNKKGSHYWFSAGNLTIPFSGKYLSPQKIQRMLRFIKETIEDSGILRFGVDELEFSKVTEFWDESNNLFVDSQCSMLVGLQTGATNCLEGRNKFDWPYNKTATATELNVTCENNQSDRLSYPPFGCNYMNLATLDDEVLNIPRNSEAMLNREAFFNNFENQPLDQLFEKNNRQQPHNISCHIAQPNKPNSKGTTPEMITTLRYEQQRLSNIQQQLALSTSMPCGFTPNISSAPLNRTLSHL